MSELTVKFNSIDLSQFFRVVDIDRADQNQIVLTVKMRTSDSRSMQKAKRELRKILMTSSYCELIFSDEPELLYYAKVVEKFDESNGVSWFQEVKIKFKTLDGYAYSTSYEYLPDDKITSANNIITIDFDNQGTVTALPIIEMTNTSENGFVGIAVDNSSLEIGNVEEVDAVPVQKSEIMYNFQQWKTQEMLSTGVQGAGIANDKLQSLTGTISTTKKPIGGGQLVDWLYLSNPGTASGYILNGQSLTLTAPADSNGEVGTLFDFIYWRQLFHTSALTQQSAIKVCVSDASGNFLYGCETIKRSNSNMTEFNCMIGNPKSSRGYDFVKRSTFQANHILSQNPFMNTNGNMSMSRNDDVITFFDRGYHKRQSDYLKGKKSAKVHIFLLKYAGKSQVADMCVGNFYWQKHHVPGIYDIPNRYPIYTQTVFDNEIGKVTINGMPERTVLGSEYIKLPPGKSTMKMHFSSFIASLPSVKVKYRKRFG
ncbi:distal tail protein Dit [Streptococcus agalactiae]|uniref:distal tail protein Dit n=1 Tax=Streptococcus agalactiae TaxID=1311 RepID=UPI0024BA1B6C|nr:distal tail protein Dit [Streptococcus agalactiae]